MQLKYILILSLFFTFSCNEIENQNKSQKPVQFKKKSITVGDAKYDGPGKMMYYHAAVKHGSVDITKPSSVPASC